MVDILSSRDIGYTVMARQSTEDRQTDSIGYKDQTPTQMLELMLTAQLGAARCVAACVSQIEQGAHLMAQTVRAGGRLFYCCLLYTSPSPRDQRGSRMPSSA